MTAMRNSEMEPTAPDERPSPRAYDPHNLSPENEEARKFDDASEEIDWDDIIATTQDDFLAGRFGYNSADYATQEEADMALSAWLIGILDEVEHEQPSVPAHDAAR